MRNLLATLLVSRGVPMILGGDEFARTQQGNNNAYCQDNPISWIDWKLRKENADLVKFVAGLDRPAQVGAGASHRAIPGRRRSKKRIRGSGSMRRQADDRG